MLSQLHVLVKTISTVFILACIGGLMWTFREPIRRFANTQNVINDLQRQNEELTLENQKIALANRLLKVDHQLAKIRMCDQYKDPQSGELISVVEFWEVDEEGKPLYPDPNDPDEPDPQRLQTVRIKGKQAYVQGLAAKFDDKFVEEGDPLRGTAMFAFKAIYGENEKPSEANRLYVKRTQPTAYYRGSIPTPFEQEMWEKFWDIANDPKRMQQLGLRALHGQGVNMELKKGNTYIVELRSTGDVTIIAQDSRKVKPWNGD